MRYEYTVASSVPISLSREKGMDNSCMEASRARRFMHLARQFYVLHYSEKLDRSRQGKSCGTDSTKCGVACEEAQLSYIRALARVFFASVFQLFLPFYRYIPKNNHSARDDVAKSPGCGVSHCSYENH